MTLLTDCTQIFAIADLIIFVTGIGMIGVGVLVAYVSSRDDGKRS